MSSELPNPPDEPADRPAAQALPPPPLPGQAEAADWTPQDWRPPPSAPATTEVAAGTDPEQIPSYGSAPEAKPPLDTVSLIALITAIPSLGLVSIPLGIWGVIRTKNKQRRGRILAVISFVLIGLWAIVGTVVGVMVGLPTTVKTAAPAPSGLVAPATVPATVSPAPATVSPTPVAPSKTKIPGHQPHGPLRKAKKVYWDQLKTGDCFKGWSREGHHRDHPGRLPLAARGGGHRHVQSSGRQSLSGRQGGRESQRRPLQEVLRPLCRHRLGLLGVQLRRRDTGPLGLAAG